MRLLTPSLDWLLICVPITLYLEHFAPQQGTAVFVFSCLAIIPLAGWMGRATESLASKMGEGIGGLLNATFGNAAELIIAIIALSRGMTEVVKASITGSIIGNILLVMGASYLLGGLRYPAQRFNATAARSQATTLSLATIALIMPAVFWFTVAPSAASTLERNLSLDISIVLLITYGLSLLFSLRTHKELFQGEEVEHAVEHHFSVKAALAILMLATAGVAWMSEILVGAVEHAAHAFGMSSIFVGVIVVAIIGNAAEHSTAVLVARKNRMDLSMGIAIGSSVQIALFVAPLLVILSYFIGPQPIDLLFTPLEIVSIALAVWIAEQTSGDGESNWFEGVQLLSVYLVLGIIFYFLP
ncbi:MAG: calcium/proton exchanger [Oligoflexia bacterium]|nr:calcium/proton exchanger [Oligoflexia bacterium]